MKSSILSVALLAFLLLTSSCAPKSDSRSTTLTGYVLLASDAGLVLKNLSTGKTDTLSQTPQGCFSPDGKYIAYFEAGEMAIHIVSAADRKKVKSITIQSFNANFSMSASDGKAVLYWEDSDPEKGTVLKRMIVESSEEPQIVYSVSYDKSPMLVVAPGAVRGSGKQALALGIDDNNGSPISTINELDFSPEAPRPLALSPDIASYANLEVSKDDIMCLAIVGKKSGRSELLQWPWSKPGEAAVVNLPEEISHADSLLDTTAYNSKNWQIAAASFSSSNSSFLCLTNAYYKPIGQNSKMVAGIKGYVLNRKTNQPISVGNLGVLDYFQGELTRP